MEICFFVSCFSPNPWNPRNPRLKFYVQRGSGRAGDSAEYRQRRPALSGHEIEIAPSQAARLFAGRSTAQTRRSRLLGRCRSKGMGVVACADENEAIGGSLFLRDDQDKTSLLGRSIPAGRFSNFWAGNERAAGESTGRERARMYYDSDGGDAQFKPCHGGRDRPI